MAQKLPLSPSLSNADRTFWWGCSRYWVPVTRSTGNLTRQQKCRQGVPGASSLFTKHDRLYRKPFGRYEGADNGLVG